jgi:glucose-1-phosphate thymidylyltransferase
MRGIVLAGGRATRLQPLTLVTSKQLLPVYNKPMIFYPLQTLIDGGIDEILIIVAPEYSGHFVKLLGDGSQFGVKLSYAIQPEPKGLPEAFKIGEWFIGDDNVCLVLGDNIFEDNISEHIKYFRSGGQIFVKQVHDPERYGVAEVKSGKVISVEEKPENPKSNLCIVGLYLYDNRVIEFAKKVQPTTRPETNITDLHQAYLDLNELTATELNGEWFDAGTFDSLLEANNFIKGKQCKNV